MNRSIALSWVALMAFVLSGPGRAAEPVVQGIQVELESPRGETTGFHLLPTNAGVEIRFFTEHRDGKRDKTARAFGPVVLSELRKTWGSQDFSIEKFRSSLGCEGMVTWTVASGRDRRRVCKDDGALRRLEELYLAVQSLMSGGN